MVTVLFRTVMIYLLLIIAMRLMGKRQIGELEVSDLVTTFLLSEIASLPISDSDLPISHAIIPIVVLLSLEVIISFLLSRFPRLKNILSARPSTLIRDGIIDQKAMYDARLSFDELFSELRQQGIDDIGELKYAILEQNGSITAVQKARYRQPNAEQLDIKTKETGLFHVVIEHGVKNSHGINDLKLSEDWLSHELSLRGLRTADIYLMLVNDAHEIKIIPKNGIRRRL